MERHSREAGTYLDLAEEMDGDEFGEFESWWDGCGWLLMMIDVCMADEIARKEEEELEAMLSLMDDRDMGYSSQEANMDDSLRQDQLPSSQYSRMEESDLAPTIPNNAPEAEPSYGSDDDDYDQIFMEVMQNDQVLADRVLLEDYTEADHEMMDMS